MNEQEPILCTAFAGNRCIASGELDRVARQTKNAIDAGEQSTILIFNDATSEPIEIDFRGSLDDVRARIQSRFETGFSSSQTVETLTASGGSRGRGRPKLGVVSREITLLPRHWEWLNSQPGGASVAIRKLVETARRANSGKDRVRQSQDATYRFMSAMAGNLQSFEEATRALFAKDQQLFEEHMQTWPTDIRDHAKKLALPIFEH